MSGVRIEWQWSPPAPEEKGMCFHAAGIFFDPMDEFIGGLVLSHWVSCQTDEEREDLLSELFHLDRKGYAAASVQLDALCSFLSANEQRIPPTLAEWWKKFTAAVGPSSDRVWNGLYAGEDSSWRNPN